MYNWKCCDFTDIQLSHIMLSVANSKNNPFVLLLDFDNKNEILQQYTRSQTGLVWRLTLELVWSED